MIDNIIQFSDYKNFRVTGIRVTALPRDRQIVQRAAQAAADKFQIADVVKCNDGKRGYILDRRDLHNDGRIYFLISCQGRRIWRCPTEIQKARQ